MIGLGAGEPDFDTPDFVKEAAIEAIRDGKTKYTNVDGTPELKEAIVAKFARDNGLTYAHRPDHGERRRQAHPVQRDRRDGRRGRRGDRPRALLGQLSRRRPVRRRHAGVRRGGRRAGLQAAPEQLEAAITPRTKWVILNSPSNPTGAAYSEDELKALGEVLERHPHVWVFADDMYEHIVYDGFEFRRSPRSARRSTSAR